MPIVLALLATGVLAMGATLSSLLLPPQAGGHELSPPLKHVATVNGLPVMVGEFELYLGRHRGLVQDYFHRRYGAGADGDFWTRSFDGEVPAQRLKQRALSDLIIVKLEQALALEHGLLEDASYSAFLQRLGAENARREEALRRGEVIYGPQQYGEAEYFSYLHANLVEQLKRRLEAGAFRASREQLLRHYRAVKGRFYQQARACAGCAESFVPFKAVQDHVRASYTDMRYRERVQRLKATAAVHLYRSVYEALSIR